jgi:hypothetical protein
MLFSWANFRFWPTADVARMCTVTDNQPIWRLINFALLGKPFSRN